MKPKLKYYFFIVLILMTLIIDVKGQVYKVAGVVMNDKKKPLSFASITIMELRIGTISKQDGSYKFLLEGGKYDISVSIIGYKTKLVSIQVGNTDLTQDIIMEIDDSINLSEVILRSKTINHANEIIRKVIANKELILSEASSYSCNVYIKASQKDFIANKRGKKNLLDTIRNGPFFDAMALAEIFLRFNKSSNGEIREERIGVKMNGDMSGLFYLSTTECDLNIYNNLLKAPSISAIPFVSPLSYGGLLAYNFKTVKIDRTGERKLYTISVKPRLLSNATIEGELVISDSLWVVLRADFRLPPSHIPEYDFFEVKQQYDSLGKFAWMMTSQKFNYYSKSKKGTNNGQTTAIYSSFELNKKFKKGYFGNELSVTSCKAYERDSVFWNSVRKEPLSRQEFLYSSYMDSLFRIKNTEAYLDSMDRLFNKITWKKILVFGQIVNDHKKKTIWILPPITKIFLPFQFGSSRLALHVAFKNTSANNKDITLNLITSYGFRNKDLNGSFKLIRMYNPFNRSGYRILAGRDFNYIYSGDAWINMLKRSNIYLKNYFSVGHRIELLNGLNLSNELEIALNRSVSSYKINPKVDSLFATLLTDNKPQSFPAYNAFYSNVKLEFTPFQQYMREPKEKIILGSRWPTFYIFWRKGISGIFSSIVNFDYLEYGITQKINLGVTGVSTYTIKTSSFPNTKVLKLVDYQYQRQGDPVYFHDPNKLFQALDSTFPLFKNYYQGNYVHEFNGYLINKIPFMKKLKLQEVVGGGFLIAPERNLQYAEVFAGLERVFKWPSNPLSKVKIGIYIVGSAANQFKNPIQLKIGLTTWDRYTNKWK